MSALERIEGQIALLRHAIERDRSRGMETRAAQYEAAVRRLVVRRDVLRRGATLKVTNKERRR